MAIKFIDAARDNPAPCGHYTLQIEVDDTSQRSHRLTLEDLNITLDQMARVIGTGPRARDIALALLWIGYQLDSGSTVAQMRGVTIAEPLP